MANNFVVPTWAGKPPVGLHLDVMKETKLIQKLMVDEKKCYFFGRNKQLCDFPIDHQSCSRVHSALIWHKHLNRPFLIDLGSTHGTFIGSIRIESKKPQQVPMDSVIHFGASSRQYVIRERPQIPSHTGDDRLNEDIEGGLLGLPETETELDNLTEFNTAHNRRIATMGDVPTSKPIKRKRKSVHVNFNEDEEVINPEDIDPSVGRFRNMVQTTVVPKKRARVDGGSEPSLTESITKRLHNFPYGGLYNEVPGTAAEATSPTGTDTFSFAAKLGIPTPNLAPSVDASVSVAPLQMTRPTVSIQEHVPSEPKRKKYPIEAWPGKRPTHSLLV